MSLLDELGARLVAQGVGVLGTTIFSGSAAILPVGNGPYLVLVETGGSGPARTQNDTATQRPTAQISARASTMAAARTKLKAAYDALGGANGLWNISLSGTMYLSITARQEPTDIGLDGAGRAMVAFNVDAEKQPS